MKMKTGQKGQILPFYFICILVICMFWFTLVNVAKLLKDRIMVQNAADNAVVSIAIMRARALNQLGFINALLGIPVVGLGLSSGGITHVWWISDFKGKLGVPDFKKAKDAKKCIENIIRYQRTIRKTYGGGTAYLVGRKIAKSQEIAANGRKTGADSIFIKSGLSLRLKPNKGDIFYWGTSYIPTPKGPIPIPVPPISSYYRKRDTERWLEQDEDNFYKQKTTLVAVKQAGSSPGYPLGGKVLGFNKWFDVNAIASAGVYNTKGPMFPEKDEERFLSIILEYKDAKDGGWEAHLVPVGASYEH